MLEGGHWVLLRSRGRYDPAPHQPFPWACGAQVLWSALTGRDGAAPALFCLCTVPSAAQHAGSPCINHEVLRSIGLAGGVSGQAWADASGGLHPAAGVRELASAARKVLPILRGGGTHAIAHAEAAVREEFPQGLTQLPACAPQAIRQQAARTPAAAAVARPAARAAAPAASQPASGASAPAALRGVVVAPSWSTRILKRRFTKADVRRFADTLLRELQALTTGTSLQRVGAAVDAASAHLAVDQAPRTELGSGPVHSRQRADALAIAGHSRRAVDALTTALVKGEAAAAHAEKQLRTGLVERDAVDGSGALVADAVPWRVAFRRVLERAAPYSAAGPSGVTPRLLWAACARSGALVDAIGDCAEWLEQRGDVPEELVRARVVVIRQHKPNGKVKLRAVACGEALTRLLERAWLLRYEDRLRSGRRDDYSQRKDGALRCGVRMQHYAAEGQCVLSLDAARAYDSVSHAAVDAALRAAGVPSKLIMAMLRKRQYKLGDDYIVPPKGVGIQQGSALGPALFALVAQRAADAAHRAAPDVVVATYLDNLYVAGAASSVEAAAVAAVRVWKHDGMELGDHFVLNHAVTLAGKRIEPTTDGSARVLGVAPDGLATERYERARRALKCASELSAQAELIIAREVARAPLTFDQRCGAAEGELRQLQWELTDQIRRRAGLPQEAVPLLEMSASARGLGLEPLDVTRNAQLVSAGLGLLLDGGEEWAWEALQARKGVFFKELWTVLVSAGYEVRASTSQVLRDDKPLVRAPRNVRAALLDMKARELRADPVMAARRDRSQYDGSDAAALVALLAQPGAKPRLTDDEHATAVRLLIGWPERGVGGECVVCGGDTHPGHHRVCTQHDQAVQHEPVKRAVVSFVNECAAAHAVPEDDVRDAGEAAQRADVRLSTGRCVEIKTVDMRQRAHRNKKFEQVAGTLREHITAKYGAIDVRPLVVSHCGSLCKESARTVTELQVLHDESWPARVGAPTLLAQLGAATARAEHASLERWRSRVEGVCVAGALLDGIGEGGNSVGTQLSPRDAGRAAGSEGEAGDGDAVGWGPRPCDAGADARGERARSVAMGQQRGRGGRGRRGAGRGMGARGGR